MISDTILDYMTHLVGGMNGGVFIIGQLIVFIFLGLVVPSSSGPCRTRYANYGTAG